jgi:hypothetical protein
MIKSLFGRIMSVGRATMFTVGLAVTLALMVGVATTALAAIPGDPFKLGRTNTINGLSTLAGAVNNAMLRIDNNSSGLSATALDLQVEPGRAPMKVNSDTQVANLNADELDGNTANDFYYFGEKVQDSEYLDGKDSTELLPNDVYILSVSRLAQGNSAGYSIYCDVGDKALSGGYQIYASEDKVTGSYPNPSAGGGGWLVWYVNDGPNSSLDLYALCADFPPLRP